MKTGDLVKMKRQPEPEGLPVGLVVETLESTSDWTENLYCVILWDDGSRIGAWEDELRVVS